MCLYSTISRSGILFEENIKLKEENQRLIAENSRLKSENLQLASDLVELGDELTEMLSTDEKPRDANTDANTYNGDIKVDETFEAKSNRLEIEKHALETVLNEVRCSLNC